MFTAIVYPSSELRIGMTQKTKRAWYIRTDRQEYNQAVYSLHWRKMCKVNVR